MLRQLCRSVHTISRPINTLLAGESPIPVYTAKEYNAFKSINIDTYQPNYSKNKSALRTLLSNETAETPNP